MEYLEDSAAYQQARQRKDRVGMVVIAQKYNLEGCPEYLVEEYLQAGANGEDPEGVIVNYYSMKVC